MRKQMFLPCVFWFLCVFVSSCWALRLPGSLNKNAASLLHQGKDYFPLLIHKN